ncbi:MAG TPA: c-type cytochrome domain-containing protein, partial [Gemmataceae bacterium]|nr:c-type cytochrome domain-containing protein [Gemmataceae bacterium]
MRSLPAIILILVTALVTSSFVSATEPDSAGVKFFESKIRPVLVDHCFACHSAGAKEVKGGLLLDSRAGVLKGGTKGPVIVAGHPDQSRLVKALHHEGALKMPPDGKLPEAVIKDFTTWIEMGAPDPR